MHLGELRENIGGGDSVCDFFGPLSSQWADALYKEKGDQIFHRVKLWVYNAITLELVRGEAFKSMQAAAEHFKVGYRTMQYHLYTK